MWSLSCCQEVRIAHVLLYSFCEVVGKTKSLADARRRAREGALPGGDGPGNVGEMFLQFTINIVVIWGFP